MSAFERIWRDDAVSELVAVDGDVGVVRTEPFAEPIRVTERPPG